ncbi:uncharacterized protein LOC126265112, partial [Aethina tumida]|uniref:uncharacterized protein LOC126265112 n=1 Tax=Aethina tumida TaxID=116153 RepID=UPI002148D8B9
MRVAILLHIFLFVLFLFSLILITSQNEVLKRKKRWLVWEPGASRMQVILGLGIPVALQIETAIIGLFLKGNYPMPTNSSVYKYPGVIYERKRRSLSRWDIYKYLSQEAELRGHDGRSCVLKAICEAADSPVDYEYGLFDELFHALFTPTTTKDELSHHTDNEYYAAQSMGLKHPGKCHNFFPNCKKSFFDKFTQ